MNDRRIEAATQSSGATSAVLRVSLLSGTRSSIRIGNYRFERVCVVLRGSEITNSFFAVIPVEELFSLHVNRESLAACLSVAEVHHGPGSRCCAQ